LTDFGISAEATSAKARTTVYSRGTSSYRAPELLRSYPAFTNKVDIWSLGCILHELATGEVAFTEDWAVKQYDADVGTVLRVRSYSSSRFLQHHVSESIYDLLHRDPEQRPRASNSSHLFSSYCRILELPSAEQLVDAQSYPSYLEWKQVAENCPFEPRLLYQLIERYDCKGARDLAAILMKDLVQKYVSHGKLIKTRAISSKAKSDEDKEQGVIMDKLGYELMEKGEYDHATLVYEALINEDPSNLLPRKNLADLYILKDDHISALQQYEIIVKLEPTNFWIWRSLCDIHVKRKDLAEVINVCKHAMIELPTNLSPVLVLINLYSAKGDYTRAIATYMELFPSHNGKKQKLISAEVINNLTLPDLSGNESKEKVNKR
jgi:serine/threonine protein kinase